MNAVNTYIYVFFAAHRNCLKTRKYHRCKRAPAWGYLGFGLYFGNPLQAGASVGGF